MYPCDWSLVKDFLCAEEQQSDIALIYLADAAAVIFELSSSLIPFIISPALA
jgi:hypothetical protein